MTSAEGKEIYKQRAATSETVNADLRTFARPGSDHGAGLGQDPLRGAVVRAGLQRDALRLGAAHLASLQGYDPGSVRKAKGRENPSLRPPHGHPPRRPGTNPASPPNHEGPLPPP